MTLNSISPDLISPTRKCLINVITEIAQFTKNLKIAIASRFIWQTYHHCDVNSSDFEADGDKALILQKMIEFTTALATMGTVIKFCGLYNPEAKARFKSITSIIAQLAEYIQEIEGK